MGQMSGNIKGSKIEAEHKYIKIREMFFRDKSTYNIVLF